VKAPQELPTLLSATVLMTIKMRLQNDKEFSLVGRNFGSKNTGLHFWGLLPARLEGFYSAGGKICQKNYLLS
jgi:hypothetical protein